jgi:hypothetical protein
LPAEADQYIRADLWDDQIETITELVIGDQMMEMSWPMRLRSKCSI